MVSGRNWLSSRQSVALASGRMCSWRKPSVCPSSCATMFANGTPPVPPGWNAVLSISTLRSLRGLFGKNERIRYCPFALTGLTSNRTAVFAAVQFASCAGT